MKKLLPFPLVIGLTLALLTLTVMTGWVTHNADLVQLWSSHTERMVFNSALCFFAIAIALILSSIDTEALRPHCAAIGWAVITLTSVVLLQYVTGIDLHVDWRPLHEWIDSTRTAPGRIAISSAIGYELSGIALVLMARAPGRLKGACIQLAILGVMAIGLIGLMGHLLRFDLIYSSLRTPRMATLVAVSLVMTAAGFWAICFRAGWKSARYPFREDDKVGLVGAAMLIGIALTVGIGGLSAQMATLEQALSDKLGPMLDSRYTLFQDSVQHGLDTARQAAQRVTTVGVINRQILRQPNGVAASSQLHELAQSLLLSGFSGIALVDVNDRTMLHEGRFVEDSPIRVDLGTQTPATLLWEDGFYLSSRLKVFDRGNWIGTLVSEQPLPEFTERFFDTEHLGHTGETQICFDYRQTSWACISNSSSSGKFRHIIDHQDSSGSSSAPTAITLSVAGQQGILIGPDYRNRNTIAAYRSLAPGLGMVVEQATAELFEPIRTQEQWTLPILLLFVAAGALFLHATVKPIATRLLRSKIEATEKEQYIRAIIDNVAEGIITLDEGGVIESFNFAAAAIFGYAPDEVLGKTSQILLPAGESIRPYLREATRSATTELYGRRKNGTTFAMDLSTGQLQFDGRHSITLIVRDITERKQAEAALFAEKERLHVTLGSIGDAVITTDTAGQVIYMNPVAETMTGWSVSDAVNGALPDVFHIINEETNELAPDPAAIVIGSERPAILPESTMLIGRIGTRFAIEGSAAPIRDRSGKAIGVVLVFHDVSAARKVADLMSHHATHDYLTDLANRREFEHNLQLSLQTVAAEHTLLYMDLDRFKIVNDSCGHEAGDELLRQLGRLLRAQLRQSDRLARLGGDEFGVLLSNCTTDPALRVAEKLLRAVSDFRFLWENKAFQIGISIGLVTFGEVPLTPQEVLRMGDAACYLAKDKGRGRVQVYIPNDTVLAQRGGEVGWLDRIRQALDENGFVLYAQRIMPLHEHPLGDAHNEDHFELLIRMVENRKTVLPMAFLPVAERYGLMPSLDRWVIQTAFSRYVELQARNCAPGTFAINLSGASVSDDHFLSFVLEQFERYAVPPHKICFEITETSAIANLSQAAALMQVLRATGCRFSLDDFGTGMSSFAYLKHLPVDYLKIDGAFVKDMMRNPIDFAMVESINHIGHVMGIQTIAEFVEDDAILNALRKMGVDFAQGYGVAKPAPLDIVLQEMAC